VKLMTSHSDGKGKVTQPCRWEKGYVKGWEDEAVGQSGIRTRYFFFLSHMGRD
jgi:hypothetical protein